MFGRGSRPDSESEVTMQEQILIPSDKMNASNEEIMADELFQVLNPDYPIPPNLCHHLRHWVEVELRTLEETHTCKNCGKILGKITTNLPLRLS